MKNEKINVKELNVVCICRRLEELLSVCVNGYNSGVELSENARKALSEEIKNFTEIISFWANYYSSADFEK